MKRKGIALALSASLLVLHIPPIANLPPVRADDSDIFGANIQPNVLILIDTSKSMDDEVPTSAYSPGTTYSGSFTATPNQGAVYKYNTSNRTYTLYKNGISQVPEADVTPTSAARDTLTASGYWYGKIGGTQYYLFNGNYMNWKAAASPTTEPKIAIAKRVITTLIQNTSGVRFGTMKFRSGGGEIVSPIGSSTSTLLAGVNALTAPGGFGTVLGEQIRDAGLYYQGSFGYASPIQYDCQPNFVIAISDGIWTGSLQPWAEAAKLNAQDWSASFSGKQNIIVHTVGFGIAVSEPANELTANADLDKTAKSGGGKFYSTVSAAELGAALQDAIQQIVAATFSFATPVVPTTSSTGSNRAYMAAFQSNPSRPFWRGYLKAYQRDSMGNVPVDANGVPLDSALVWEAGQQLTGKAASSRTIYTLVSGSRVDFKTTTASITAAMLGVSTSADQIGRASCRERVFGLV